MGNLSTEKLYELSFDSRDSNIFSNLFQEGDVYSRRMSFLKSSLKPNTICPPSIMDRKSEGSSIDFESQEIGDASSMGTLSTDSSFNEEQDNIRGGSGETFTLTMNEHNTKFQLPPIDTSNNFAFGTDSMYFSSASEARRIRKISKVSTKTKTQQDDLAEAVIDGDITKVEEIVDVLSMLYGERGVAVVMSYLYEYDPPTHLVKCLSRTETSESQQNSNNF